MTVESVLCTVLHGKNIQAHIHISPVYVTVPTSHIFLFQVCTFCKKKLHFKNDIQNKYLVDKAPLLLTWSLMAAGGDGTLLTGVSLAPADLDIIIIIIIILINHHNHLSSSSSVLTLKADILNSASAYKLRISCPYFNALINKILALM